MKAPRTPEIQVAHYQTRLQAIFVVVEPGSENVRRVPVNLEIDVLSEEAFAEAVQTLRQAREDILKQLQEGGPG